MRVEGGGGRQGGDCVVEGLWWMEGKEEGRYKEDNELKQHKRRSAN